MLIGFLETLEDDDDDILQNTFTKYYILRKNNRRGRLLNTLINSNNEVINVTSARNEQRKFTPKISSNPPRSFKISAIVSKHTKQIAPDY